MPRFSRAIWNELKGLTEHEIEVISKFERDTRGTMFVAAADILRKRGYIDETIVILEDGIKNFPQYYSARAALARDYYLKGMMVEARHHSEVVVQKSVDNVMAQRLKLKLDLLFDDRDEVRNRLKICKQLFPDDPLTIAIRDAVAIDDWDGARGQVLAELRRLGIKWDLASDIDSTERALERLQFEAEKTKTKEVMQPEWTIPLESEPSTPLDGTESRSIVDDSETTISEVDESILPQALRSGTTLATVRGDAERYLCLRGFRRLQTEGLFSVGIPESSKRNMLDQTTLAEIYLTQGLVAKAIGIYNRLVKDHPAVERYQKRLSELKAMTRGAAISTAGAPAEQRTASPLEAKATRMTPETEKKLRFLEALLKRLDVQVGAPQG
jgi:tetratricopeptide (TPR) repeat protein